MGIYLISLLLTIFLFFVLVQRILSYYPNYPTHRLYFGEVETPYRPTLKIWVRPV